MNLTWHIAKKDLRRMAIPAALWCALVVGSAVWMLWSSMPAEASFADLAHTWFEFHSAFATVLGLLQLMIAYVLIGALMLEDIVVGSKAFWLTRPIAGRRMLAGKTVAAIALFIVAPVLVLLPVWGLARFSPADFLHAATVTTIFHAALVLYGMLVASLTRNLGQYFLATLTLIVAQVGGLVLGTTKAGPNMLILNGTHGWIVLAIGLLLLGGFVAWQYSARRTAFAWAVLVASLVAVVGVLRGRLLPGFGEWANQTPIAAGAAGTLEIDRIERSQGAIAVPLRGAAAARDDVFVVPIHASATIANGSETIAGVDLRLTERWDENLGERLLPAGSSVESPLTWTMNPVSIDHRHDGGMNGPVQVTGSVVAVTVHLERIGTLPLQRGATARDGATWVRVAGVLEEENGKIAVALEEHGHGMPADPWMLARLDQDLSRNTIAVYVVADRSNHRLEHVSIRNRGTFELNGIAVTVTDLVIAPPAGDPPTDWSRGLSIVVVRLRPERYERIPLAAQNVPVVEEGPR